jgi:hypothetical protein
MRKLVRELRREIPGVVISTSGGNHLRLKLPNGGELFVSATPSDRRTMRNVRAAIRRLMTTRTVQ